MDYKFKFIKGRTNNVEIFRVKVTDPINGNRTLDPATLSKIELRIGSVIISSETNEITWEDDVIQIKPLDVNIASLNKLLHSELVAYQDGDSMTIAEGIVEVSDNR